MRPDYPGDTWSGATYNGFSGAPPITPEATTPAPRRGRRRGALIAGGVAVALALGLGLGLLSRPHLNVASTPAMHAATPAMRPEAAPPQLPIEVQPAAPQATPKPAGRLEVLPPQTAHAAAAPARAASPAAPAEAPPAPVIATPPPLPQVIAPPAPQVAPAPMPVPAPRLRAGFDCAGARPGAEQMVCSDPQLAALDRQMTRAYRRALNLADDPDAVRADQRDWMAIREDAARHGRHALADVYLQRLDELNSVQSDDGY